jgi:lysophospholipase L1-like esterase
MNLLFTIVCFGFLQQLVVASGITLSNGVSTREPMVSGSGVSLGMGQMDGSKVPGSVSLANGVSTRETMVPGSVSLANGVSTRETMVPGSVSLANGVSTRETMVPEEGEVTLAVDHTVVHTPSSTSFTETTTYATNDPNIYYSPYQWLVNENSASTINSASYVRFMFSGSFLNFTFDVSNMVSPISEVYWKIDNGPMTHSLVLSVVTVEIPVNNTHGDVPYHSVELFVKSTTETANRWSATGPSTRVILTGIVTDGTLAPWIPNNVNVLIYGDSITEGVLCLGGSQRFDTDHNDASVVYSYTLARLLGTEIGVVGFGATGLSRGGSGGVPALGISWNQLWNGVPRSFSPRPDLILFNEGTNDGSNNITSQMAIVLQNLLIACPGTPIVVMLPFNGSEESNLKAAIDTVNSNLISFLDTTGFYNQTLGGGLHPTGPNDVARIAPQIANNVRSILAKSIASREEF